MTRDPFALPDGELRGHVTKGVLTSGAAQAVRLFVQIASVVLLSRLLAPEEFGLAAMAAPILSLAVLFQEFGITQAIVQKPNLNHAEASTMFWLGFGLSIVLALALVLASPLVADFYRKPRVGELTAAMALIVVITGAGAQHLAVLNRGMRLGTLAALDATAALVGLLVMLVWALFDPTFWALFAGSLATAAIPAIGAWQQTRWLPSRPRRGTGVRSALHFGAGVAGFNFANFFARNADNVMIGRVWGDRPLGLYDRAYKLMLLPIQQINAPLSRVMLPALSRLADDPDRYRHAYLRMVNQLLLVTLPGIAFMIATSDRLVDVVLGSEWRETAPIFAALGFAGLLQPLNNTCGWLFVSQARTWQFMRWGAFNAATSVIGFALGLPYGPQGVAIVYAIGEFIRTPLLWIYVTRSGPIRLRDAVGLGMPHLAGAFATIGVVRLIGNAVEGPPSIVLAVLLPCAYAVSILVIAPFPKGRAALRETIGIVRSGLGRVNRRRA